MLRYHLTQAEIEALPILIEGNSKVVREFGPDRVVCQLKPTVHSHSAKRAGTVPGTDEIRLRCSEILWDILEEHGISTTIVAVGSNFFISEKVDPPPIEVIVKGGHFGTPKHIYYGMENVPVRPHCNIFSDRYIEPDKVHQPYVRFDWRNPLPHKDECMPWKLADYFIDVDEASKTAMAAFRILQRWMARCELQLIDICFFITQDGKKIFSEVSPDCMRARYQPASDPNVAGRSLDKDLWRRGASDEELVEKWQEFYERIKVKHDGHRS